MFLLLKIIHSIVCVAVLLTIIHSIVCVAVLLKIIHSIWCVPVLLKIIHSIVCCCVNAICFIISFPVTCTKLEVCASLMRCKLGLEGLGNISGCFSIKVGCY